MDSMSEVNVNGMLFPCVDHACCQNDVDVASSRRGATLSSASLGLLRALLCFLLSVSCSPKPEGVGQGLSLGSVYCDQHAGQAEGSCAHVGSQLRCWTQVAHQVPLCWQQMATTQTHGFAAACEGHGSCCMHP